MRILLSFIHDNRLRLVDWFNQFDKDHSGGISREEFKIGLKETGLVMTQVTSIYVSAWFSVLFIGHFFSFFYLPFFPFTAVPTRSINRFYKYQ